MLLEVEGGQGAHRRRRIDGERRGGEDGEISRICEIRAGGDGIK